MNKDLSACIAAYQKQLEQGDIQVAYLALMRYIAQLKAKFPAAYTTGGLSYGYLDFTYFPFFNDYLRQHKLRFGIVLNHKAMQFELWLMGQNASLQQQYWNKLKDSVWNQGKTAMPQYSFLEVCLENRIDFAHKETMTASILARATSLAQDIQQYLQTLDGTQ